MSDLQLHNYKAWDRLFDLLYTCDETVSDAEVDASLLQAGIDMQPAFRRLHEMLDQQRARTKLTGAAEVRASLMEKLRGVVAPKVDDLRTTMHNLISRSFTGQEQLAHFHKLAKAATDEDLQSLLDDLAILEKLKQTKDTNGPEGE